MKLQKLEYPVQLGLYKALKMFGARILLKKLVPPNTQDIATRLRKTDLRSVEG